MTSVDRTEHHVRIGQVKIGRPGETLTAILGSCVGIGFLHPAREIYGLSHCLLSKSQGPIRAKTRAGVGEGRHVDQAIASLLSMMEVGPDELKQLRVILAGGANMSMPVDTPAEQLVGTTNAKFARSSIRAAGLRLLDDDLGGTNGRRVTIDCDSGEFEIQSIPRLGGKGQ